MGTVFQYTTVQGDAFDSISFDLFKSEKFTGDLILANPVYMDVVNFDSGIVLTIPVVPVNPNLSAVPWGVLISTA